MRKFEDSANICGRDLTPSVINFISAKSLGREVRELRLRRKLICKQVFERILATESPEDDEYKILSDLYDTNKDLNHWFIDYVEKGLVDYSLIQYIHNNLQFNYSVLKSLDYGSENK